MVFCSYFVDPATHTEWCDFLPSLTVGDLPLEIERSWTLLRCSGSAISASESKEKLETVFRAVMDCTAGSECRSSIMSMLLCISAVMLYRSESTTRPGFVHSK